MKRKAVFIDRDGTINRDVGYPSSYAEIDIYPFSFEAIKRIKEAGLLAVIVTNQSGIGRGLIEEKSLQDIHNRMRLDFKRHKVTIDGLYYCPHYISSKRAKYRQDCSCRKPKPGMGQLAAKDLQIDTSSSYMIGDKVDDILFGINIKAASILVLTGFGQASLKELEAKGIQPAFVAKDLLDAANWIVEQERSESSS